MNAFQAQLKQLAVIPVVTPYSVNTTLKMTEAMLAGGIASVEITLRTDCAWESIAAVMAERLPVKVGVGTITSVELFKRALDCGADFAVSPGITPKLIEYAAQTKLPFLPGIATASELMMGIEAGFETFKLFPAMAINAPALLSAFSGPFPETKFCPTGGVNEKNATELLARNNVICVGGSWMIPKAAVEAQEWAKITELSKEAMSLAGATV
ncbi:bifunctional 4-hydroxy-2-oxoglutarate aldolase/2-dehydro-3-deoxy-phosphogluconate aldolase [Halioxenophilus sp. WMMB6]|uniref:bifunctional 4-hydroxy-2-oxoglutarate aldolase/2-dehydro-3-deoxy-phosphogluconate aldolase n=1 Tax=Halioxenophilus sp. WMMB6 TaxID=3073815 RepID=UPI00295F4ED3|nr:bifunctional 4-hydroxy-2-oxoglutarate aldolase/2-dehydro-3-deoxy-phosphogluconate aldolase [Halioxenophilus sp. WMMB6]